MTDSKFLFIPVTGEVKILNLTGTSLLDDFYQLIGCDSIEIVQVVGGKYLMVIDDEGKVCNPPKDMNIRASCGYPGFPIDHIVGDVLIGKFNGVDDIVGLSSAEASELQRIFSGF